MNDRLQRVQVGRDEDVPIFDCWYLFIRKDGSWDAGQSNDDFFFTHLTSDYLEFVFAVWHGNHRTNLFLMDAKKLYKRFMKERKPLTCR